MSTNDYIIMIMYDIPINNNKDRKDYVNFRKILLKKGYYQLQESIYICKVSYKSTITSHQLEMKKLAPKDSNVRMLVLTKNQFNSMYIIAGEKTFFESILSEERKIIEL